MYVRARLFPRLFALGSFFLLSACGGPSYAGGIYRDGALAFRVQAPPGEWSSVRVGDQNDLAWEQRGTHAVLQVNGSCDPGLDIPLAALTNHLLIGFTERDLREQTLITLDGREALRTHLVAKIDGVPREFMLVVLKKDNCVFDFAVLAAPGESFAQAHPAFERVLDSFRFGDRSP